MTVILYKYTDNINIKLAIISKTMCFIINRSEVVKLCFVMELAGLKGRERLAGYKVESAIIYEGK